MREAVFICPEFLAATAPGSPVFILGPPLATVVSWVTKVFIFVGLIYAVVAPILIGVRVARMAIIHVTFVHLFRIWFQVIQLGVVGTDLEIVSRFTIFRQQMLA